MILLQRISRHPKTNFILRSPKYIFRDSKCLGRTCFRPEERLIPPGRVLYGTNLRRLPRKTWVCGHRKDFGCPLEESYTIETFLERVEDGWQSGSL